MSSLSKMVSAKEARMENEQNFDPVAYAEEVMKKVGSDFHEDDPLFQTNEFRMHCYKILPCTKHFCHDWSVCPFAHFSERAKRRDPKNVKYTAIACPDMKKGEDCPRGDRCPYSHNTFEYWLHPTRYRTRLCRDNGTCNRKICFFAHKPEEVRVPVTRPSLPISEDTYSPDGLSIHQENSVDSLPINHPAPQNNTAQMDQVSQIQAILQNSGLTSAAETQPTLVDQMLSGMLAATSGMNVLHPTEAQYFQIAQAAQNLSFDSCFPSQGPQRAMPSLFSNNHFPAYDAFPNLDSALSGYPSSSMPFAPTGARDISLQRFNCPPLTTKVQPDWNEMIQLISGMNMASSPTSVLPCLQPGGLAHRAFSAEESIATGLGLGDPEFGRAPFHPFIDMNGSGRSNSVGTVSPLIGMNL